MTDHEAADEIRYTRSVNVKLILALVAVGAFVVFALQNADSVSVTFLAWDFEMPLIVLMLLSAIVGVLAWELATRLRRRRRRGDDER